MASEELFDKIAKTEEDARKKLEEAREEHDKIIKEAHQKALKMQQESIANLDNVKEKASKDILKTISTKKKKILAQGEVDLKELQSISKKNHSKAVEYILRKLEEEI